jgi:parallel beta-helix repeat protein
MPGAWNRTVIRRNQVYNVGGTGITIGNCKDCVIEDNIVVGGSHGIQYPDPGNRCSSVAYPPRSDYNCSGNLADSGGIVRNNTVVNAGAISINDIGGQGSGWLATNNAVCGGGASVSTGGGTTTDHNLVNGSCSGWFQNLSTDPATASFKPGARLIDAGGTVSEGSSYISVQPWSALDPGVAPSGTPGIGAVR